VFLLQLVSKTVHGVYAWQQQVPPGKQTGRVMTNEILETTPGASINCTLGKQINARANTTRCDRGKIISTRLHARSVHMIRNYFRRRHYNERANKKTVCAPMSADPVLIVVLRIYLCVPMMIPFYLLFDV
jgi:hypothetical protein